MTSFVCEDKVPGIAYADVETDCRMFHVCIPVAKGKLRDYQLRCAAGHAYNQATALCEPTADRADFCRRAARFYVYNKWFRPEAKKDAWKAYIKKNAKKF